MLGDIVFFAAHAALKSFLRTYCSFHSIQKKIEYMLKCTSARLHSNDIY